MKYSGKASLFINKFILNIYLLSLCIYLYVFIYKVFRWKNENYISKKYFDVLSSTVLYIYIYIYIYIYLYLYLYINIYIYMPSYCLIINIVLIILYNFNNSIVENCKFLLVYWKRIIILFLKVLPKLIYETCWFCCLLIFSHLNKKIWFIDIFYLWQNYIENAASCG